MSVTWAHPHFEESFHLFFLKSRIQMRKKFCNYLPEGKTQTTSTNVTSKVRRIANMTCQLGHMRSHEASCKKGAWSILHWNDRSIKHPAKKELWASCHTQRSFEHPANQAAPSQDCFWTYLEAVSLFLPALTEPSLPHYVTLAPVKLFLTLENTNLPWEKMCDRMQHVQGPQTNDNETNDFLKHTTF